MAQPRRPLRVLHTADIHVDDDEQGWRAWSRIVDRALADEVDLLLVAGDLFDHNRVAAETVAFVRAELGRLRQPAVILPGNHDALHTGAIYDRHDFTTGPGHVRVICRLDGQAVELPELDVIVWGRAMETHVPEFQPLAHIPRRDERRWCLAMAHGFFYAERQRPARSSPIFADEVRDTGWDYVALGHHHVRTDVSQGGVAACYAGAPDGTVLRVDFSSEMGVRIVPRPL
jgi:DNA repair exonuclease SbcCD nuclease subunit